MLVATALFALAGLALVPSAATADPTPFSAENFSPDAAPATGATNDTLTTVMSDRSDGGNATFHATTVTTASASLVQYYICPTAFPDAQVDAGADVPPADDPTVAANGCGAPVGVDTTGALPTGPGVPATAGEVYEAEIDIGVDGVFDFVAWVCGGSTTTDADCDAEVEPNVTMDDGSTNPGTASSSGEITSPVHGGNLSNAGFVASARTSPDVTAVTFCLAIDGAPAGDPADEGDGTAGDGDPTACVTDADFAGPGTSTTIKSDVEANNPSSQQATFKTWSVTYNDAETPDNYEMALVMYEGTSADGDPPVGPSPANPAESGAGSCATGAVDCQLDSHYVITTPPAGARAVIAFPDEGGTSTMPNNCNEPEATGTGDEEPRQYSRVQGCILDQSNNNITNNQHWAFQIVQQDAGATATDETGFECQTAAPGKTCSDTNFPNASVNSGEHQVQITPGVNFPNYECNGRAPAPITTAGTGCPSGPVGADGIQGDTNADRFYEQVDGDPGQTAAGTAGIADEVVEFHTTGIYQITFCLDAADDAKTSATPCANDTLVSTGTKTVTGPVDHVHVKEQGKTDALCHTGDAFATAEAGSTVTLQGCTLALFGTDESPSIGAHVAWVLNPAGAPDSPGSLKNAETSVDTGGRATAQVTSDKAAAGKSITIRFCLDEFPASTTGGPNGNGVCDSAEAASGALAKTHADIRIDWTESKGPDPGGQCSASREKSGENEILIGTNGRDTICGFGGNDTIRGLGGPDILKGGSGNDLLVGGSGADKLLGGGGRDSLKGGKKGDILKGQGGKDTANGGKDDDTCFAEKEKRCER